MITLQVTAERMRELNKPVFECRKILSRTSYNNLTVFNYFDGKVIFNFDSPLACPEIIEIQNVVYIAE